MKRRIVPLLAALGLLAAGTGCPAPECTEAADCAQGQTCQAEKCVAANPDGCSPTCGGSTPVCDTTAKSCKVCTESEGCPAGTVCDTSVPKGMCIECRKNEDCTGTTPFCDPVGHTCAACTDTEGCKADEVCDTSSSPRGKCVKRGCTSNAQCGGETPVCDTSVAGGACVTCTGTAGCGNGKVCDTAVAGGACVTCTATAGCTDGKVCDTSVSGGSCVACLTNAQCSGATPACDTATKTCVTCTATAGCSGATPVCDTAVNGGKCVACTGNAHCGNATPICDTATNTCVVCKGAEGCSNGQECQSGVCIGCTADSQCSGQTPICETTSKRCVTCTEARGCTDNKICKTDTNPVGVCVECTKNEECTTSTAPLCDTVAFKCVKCTATAGCSGETPVCDTSVAGGSCVQCVADAQCPSEKPICGASHTCEAPSPASISAQITAVRDSADGTTLALPVSSALVTFVRPLVGADPAGFFVQAEQDGPALFVAVDPTTLNPAPVAGSRVRFTVTGLATQTATSTMKHVTAISNYSVLATGEAVAPLVQDLSNAPDVVTNLNKYESEMVKITGTVANFSNAGAGHDGALFSTQGVPSSNDFKLRMPTALRESLDLVNGCMVTLDYGPMWRYKATAQPMAFQASDLKAISCPAPKVLSANANTNTEVLVTFDRFDPATILANGSQFTFSGGLTASAAVVNGTKVTVTTSPQTAGTAYTLTVAGTVKEKYGAGIAAPDNTATFHGKASGGLCTPSQIVISQVYGGGGNSGATLNQDFVELHNRGTTPVNLAGWSLQYASATGTTWSKSTLTGTINPGGYFLVAQGTAGANGSALPTPDATGTLTMGASSGKIALINSETLLTGACPQLPNAAVVDIVGFGTAASNGCFEGAEPTAAPSATKSVIRNQDGCLDTDTNKTDFTAVTPAPRNSSTAPVACGCN